VTIKSLDDLLAEGVRGRRVLVRADLNVPLRKLAPESSKSGSKEEAGVITDDGRIRAVLPTLIALRDAGARLVVMSHLGRPLSQKAGEPARAPDLKYTLAPVAVRMTELLGSPVAFAADTVGEKAKAAVAALGDGGVVLLENLRFNPGETSKDEAERTEFAAALASLGEAYVDDAFGAVHRKHASVYDVPKLLPHFAGGLVLREVEVLRGLTENVNRPYVVVLGGAKVSDKLAVIKALLPTVDRLLIGGGMCFTFLKAQGHEIGKSLLEEEMVKTCSELLVSAGEKILLPTDVVAATAFGADAEHDVVPADAIPADRLGLDVGPATVRAFSDALAGARTVFWNGPMGVFELAPFAAGTRGVAEAITKVDSFAGGDQSRASTVVGGGDSAAAVRALGIPEESFGHISTGGGASLEYLEGKTLPGLAALQS
jgi:phosphoglycerate kinase